MWQPVPAPRASDGKGHSQYKTVPYTLLSGAGGSFRGSLPPARPQCERHPRTFCRGINSPRSADMPERFAMADVTRREFFKITGVSLAGSSLALLGFSPTAAIAEVREFKLARATETR